MTAKEAKAYLIQYRESLDLVEETAAHLAELKAEAVRLKDHKGQSIKLDAFIEGFAAGAVVTLAAVAAALLPLWLFCKEDDDG